MSLQLSVIDKLPHSSRVKKKIIKSMNESRVCCFDTVELEQLENKKADKNYFIFSLMKKVLNRKSKDTVVTGQ